MSTSKYEVAVWFPMVTPLCYDHEAHPHIQSVRLAVQRRKSCVQFYFHISISAFPLLKCSVVLTLDGKIILQFRLNEF